MSRHQVIRRVGEELRRVLIDAFEADPNVGPLFPSGVDQKVSLAPPVTEDPATAPAPLSLWLYQVSENEYLRNRPQAVASDGTLRRPPLALSLNYLVTPVAKPGPGSGGPPAAELHSQELLGKVLETFHDNAIIALVDGAVAEELHLALCRMTIVELSEVWEALRQPYRLSVCYRVNVARIDSRHISRGALIVERRLEYHELFAHAG